MYQHLLVFGLVYGIDIFSVISLKGMLKQSNFQWFETLRFSCDITVNVK